jgi:hypothetical protein
VAEISSIPFDGAAAWARLTPEQQARVGALALELVASWAIIGLGEDGAVARAAEEAKRLSLASLVTEFHYELVEHLQEPGGAYRLPSVLGMVCRGCGCSHLDPCEEGCGWAADNLCTACAPDPEIARLGSFLADVDAGKPVDV